MQGAPAVLETKNPESASRFCEGQSPKDEVEGLGWRVDE